MDDDATGLSLIETDVDTGVFESEAMLLMSPDLPLADNPDDDAAVWSDRVKAFVPDDASEDRTHRASVDGQVKVSYQGQRGPYEKTIDVSDRNPDSRKTLRIRVHVHLEPFEDTGYSDPASPVPMLGAGNGVFDFKDVNGDDVHDAGERVLGPRLRMVGDTRVRRPPPMGR